MYKEKELEKEKLKRPIGCKRVESLDRCFELEGKKIKAAETFPAPHKESKELIKGHQEMLSFTSNTDTADPIVNEYMHIKRRWALKWLNGRKSTVTTHETTSSNLPAITSKRPFTVAEDNVVRVSTLKTARASTSTCFYFLFLHCIFSCRQDDLIAYTHGLLECIDLSHI